MKNQYTSLNRWIGFFILNCLSALVMYSQNIFSLMLVSDVTFISFGIMIIYLLVTFSLGYKTYKLCKNRDKMQSKWLQKTGIEWYIKEELPTLGLIGTIIGLMIVLGPAFAAIDPASTESLASAISYITLGVGSALWTTVAGLVSYILIGIQLMNLERAMDNV
jgi:hypothetical protein